MGLFSRSRLRGAQGGRAYTTAQVWAPAGLRGARSGHSKSRELASNHGIALRRGRASQDNGNPHFSFDAPLVSHTVTNTRFPLLTATDTSMRVWTTTPRVWTVLARVSAVCAPHVCMCAGLCVCVLALGSPSFRIVFRVCRGLTGMFSIM